MKKPTFKTVLLILCAVYALVVAAGLWIFYGWLARYEQHHPVGAMNGYFEQLKSGKTDAVIADSEFPFDAYNTKEIYLQYLSEKYRGGYGKWQYADMDTDKSDAILVYDVYENDQKYGTLYLTERDGGTYSVRSDWAWGEETVIESPLTPLVNGAAATPEGEVQTVALFDGAAGELPTFRRYRVRTLLPPVITAAEGEAESETVNGVIRLTAKPTAADDTALRTAAETAARTYACFISGDLPLAEINALLESGTPFAKGVRSYDQKWYNKHKSVAFEQMTVSAPIQWSADAFTVQVSFDFVVSRGYDSHTYPTKYNIALRRAGNGYKVTNIASI